MGKLLQPSLRSTTLILVFDLCWLSCNGMFRRSVALDRIAGSEIWLTFLQMRWFNHPTSLSWLSRSVFPRPMTTLTRRASFQEWIWYFVAGVGYRGGDAGYGLTIHVDSTQFLRIKGWLDYVRFIGISWNSFCLGKQKYTCILFRLVLWCLLMWWSLDLIWT